jgi:hypothetical protein
MKPQHRGKKLLQLNMPKPLPPLDYLRSVLEFKDGLLYNKVFRSSHAVAGKRSGSPWTKGYMAVSVKGVKYLEHRIVFYMENGYCPETVDHINGDKTDNRIENLRAATYSENQCNVPLASNNVSGHKGVTFHKRAHKWRAQIAFKKVVKHLGYFETKELAAEFVELARDMLHNNFANHGVHRSI